MPGNLGGFLVDLSKNAVKMKEFKNDPHQTMVGAGLSETEMNAVFSKRPDLITQAIGPRGGLAAADADTTVVVIVL